MEKFEQDIEKRLADFNITPSPQVWKDVEAVLHERRKKRFAIWLWFPIAAICLGLTWLFFMGDKETAKHTIIAETATNAKSRSVNETKKLEGKNVAIEKNALSNINQEPFDSNIKSSTQQSNKNNTFFDKINNRTSVDFTTRKANVNKKNQATVEGKQEADAVETIQSSSTTEQQKQSVTTVIEKQADSLSIKDSTTLAVKENKQIPLTKDSTIATKETKKTIEKNKKHQWYIIGSGGLSLVKSSTLFSSNTTSPNFTNSSVSSSPSGIGSSRNVMHLKSPNTGLLFSVGINYERTINKHWSAVTGLQYRYIQNKQNIEDSAYRLLKTETNHAHWLQLPLNIQYGFNAFAGNKFQLQAGASIAWAFSESWLAIKSNGSYNYDKALNNNIIFNLNAVVSMLSKKGYKFSLLAEQSLTPIHKKDNYNYYFQQYSFQVGIPFNLVLKTKK